MGASAFHSALLVTALACVASVATELAGPWTRGEQALLPPLMMLAAAIGFPAVSRRLRHAAAWAVAQPAARGRVTEIALVAIALALVPCAASGAAALWHWHQGGSDGLAALVLHQREAGASVPGLALLGAYGYAAFLVATAASEELYLRGLLLPALEREWGWTAALVAAATLGALCESALLPGFASGLVLGSLRRRARSVTAPILAHCAASAMAPMAASLWAVPDVAPAGATLVHWAFPLGCLGVLAAWVPSYVGWAQRVPEAARLEPPAALPLHS